MNRIVKRIRRILDRHGTAAVLQGKGGRERVRAVIMPGLSWTRADQEPFDRAGYSGGGRSEMIALCPRMEVDRGDWVFAGKQRYYMLHARTVSFQGEAAYLWAVLGESPEDVE